MRVIFGTGNKGKIEQLKTFFEDRGTDLEILSIKDIGFDQDIIEDGKTLEENSMIKAKVIKKFCDEKGLNEIIVTDDSGLCVPALNGEPGVLSARYAGENGTQEQILTKLLNNMKDFEKEQRKATFECVLTAVLKDGRFVQVKGVTNGSVTKEVKKYGGLTYCPVFMPDGFDKVLADFEPNELETTHREKAFLELMKIFENMDKNI